MKALTRMFTIFTLLGAAAIFAQSASSGANMASNFSAEAIAAYRDSSVSKISDFYEYLDILSDPAATKELTQQIRENILMLFASDAAMIADLTSESNEKVSLLVLLDKVKGRGLRFSLQKAQPSTETFSDHWKITCSIGIADGSKRRQMSLVQKVYFLPGTLKFGRTEKVIWSARLGATE